MDTDGMKRWKKDVVDRKARNEIEKDKFFERRKKKIQNIYGRRKKRRK